MKHIKDGSRGCVVCVLSDLNAGQPRIRGSPAGKVRDLLIPRPTKPNLDPPSLLFKGYNWGGGTDDDQQLPSSSEIKNKWRDDLHGITVEDCV